MYASISGSYCGRKGGNLSRRNIADGLFRVVNEGKEPPSFWGDLSRYSIRKMHI
jgi:hypothetical protein